MAEDAGGGMWAEAGKRISFAAETISKGAAEVAGNVWSHLTQTQFSVDIEQAPKLIAALEQAVGRLDDAYEESERLRRAQSPGKDPYSGFTVLAVRKAAGDEEGGYGWANREAVKALAKTIENINRAVASYRQTDDAARDGLKS